MGAGLCRGSGHVPAPAAMGRPPHGQAARSRGPAHAGLPRRDQGGGRKDGMTADDYSGFARGLRGTAGILSGRRLSEDICEAYFRALQDVDLGPLLRVLERLAKTAESGARFPTPAELRQRAGGSVTAPDAPLGDLAFERVRQAVQLALAPYRDATSGLGRARPAFEDAWKAARRREGWGGTVNQREALWQDWLQGGPDMSRATATAILASIRPRVRSKPVLAVLEHLSTRPAREPGEEG